MTGGKCPLVPAPLLPGCFCGQGAEAMQAPVLQCRAACCPHCCGVGHHFNSIQVSSTQIV